MHGALLVDKPPGPTSHDVVAFARRVLNTPRIGHTGTLDPLATGLLVLLVGHATRLSQFLVTDEKEYLADIRLGLATPTYDAQGVEARGARGEESEARGARRQVRGGRGDVEAESCEAGGARRDVTLEQIQAVLPSFLGTFPQLPPPFSAKKVDGVRAYTKARKSEPVSLKAVEVTVRELEVVDHQPPDRALRDQGPTDQGPTDQGPTDQGPTDQGLRDQGLIRLRVVCSSGFYVRSLAHDLGQLLGCGAHLEGLRRTRAGQFLLADAVSMATIESEGETVSRRLVDLNALLARMPAVGLTEDGLRRAWNGNTLGPGHLRDPLGAATGSYKVRLLDGSGTLLSVAERRPDGLLHPLLVLR